MTGAGGNDITLVVDGGEDDDIVTLIDGTNNSLTLTTVESVVGGSGNDNIGADHELLDAKLNGGEDTLTVTGAGGNDITLVVDGGEDDDIVTLIDGTNNSLTLTTVESVVGGSGNDNIGADHELLDAKLNGGEDTLTVTGAGGNDITLVVDGGEDDDIVTLIDGTNNSLTLTTVESVVGGSGNDNIGADHELLDAKLNGGEDTLTVTGAGGNDITLVVDGGEDDDIVTLIDGTNNSLTLTTVESVVGGSGNDNIGADHELLDAKLNGGEDTLTVTGAGGNDITLVVDGGEDDDIVTLIDGTNNSLTLTTVESVVGGSGNDNIGADHELLDAKLNGGEDTLTVTGAGGNDITLVVDGGEDDDIVTLIDGTNNSLTLTTVESVVGGSGNDNIGADHELLDAKLNGGEDTLTVTGAGGNDITLVVDGGEDDDIVTLIDGTNNSLTLTTVESVVGGSGNDNIGADHELLDAKLNGGEDTLTVTGAGGNDITLVVDGGEDDDIVTLIDGTNNSLTLTTVESVVGGSGNDNIGADHELLDAKLNGGEDTLTVTGAGGNDITLVVDGGEDDDIVTLIDGTNNSLTLTTVESVVGGSGNDNIGADHELLDAKLNGGEDTLTVTGAGGNDITLVVDGGEDDDIVTLIDGTNNSLTLTTVESVVGGSGNDNIGADHELLDAKLNGGEDTLTVTGAGGNDITLVVDGGEDDDIVTLIDGTNNSLTLTTVESVVGGSGNDNIGADHELLDAKLNGGEDTLTVTGAGGNDITLVVDGGEDDDIVTLIDGTNNSLTLTTVESVVGGSGNDNIGADHELLDAKLNGGEDTLTVTGAGGNDITLVVDGGEDDDIVTLIDGTNNSLTLTTVESVVGGSGNDNIGADHELLDAKLNGGEDTLTVTGAGGNDITLVVDGGEDDDIVTLIDGTNNSLTLTTVESVVGGSGNDNIGADHELLDAKLNGGEDTLTVTGAGGNDITLVVDGGEDDDIVTLIDGTNNSLTLTTVESVVGGSGNDNIGADHELLDAKLNGGEDTLTVTGAGGNDITLVVDGGEDDDIVTLIDGTNNSLTLTTVESVVGGSGNDNIGADHELLDAKLNGGEDTLTVTGAGGNDITLVVDGGEDDDIVTLIDGTNNSLTLTTVESVVGGSGNDNIGADHELLDAKLNGGEDTLTVTGAGGNDITLVVDGGEDDDIVTLIDGTNNSLTLTTVESVVGGSGNDNIGADHELLDAKLNGGEDTLTVTGAGGNDITLVVDGGEDDDIVTLIDGTNNSLTLTTVESVVGGSGNDNIGADHFLGDATLWSGEDTLTVTGAGGNDITLVVDGGEDDDIVTLIDGTNNSLTLTTVESVVGGSGNDNIGADHELLDAKLNGGEDTLTVTGAGGNDITLVVDGGEDDDIVTLIDGTNNSLTLTTVESVVGGSGNDTITVTDGSLTSGDLGDGNDRISLGAATTATIDGGLGSDTLTGSDQGDTLRLTGFETVTAGTGNDDITITDNLGADIDLGLGDDTLTLEKGGAFGNGTLDGGSGTDVVNVYVNENLTGDSDLDLNSNFSGIERVNLVDQSETDNGHDIQIVLASTFNNGNAIIFDASTSFDAITSPSGNTNGLDVGESLIFDASAYGQSVSPGGADDEISVVGGAGNDTITTAELDIQRGLMTVDVSTGGIDTVVIANDGWNGEGLYTTSTNANETITNIDDWENVTGSLSHGVEIFGFTGGQAGDKLDVQYGDGTSTTGGIQEGYVLGTGNPINKASGTVIELDSSDYTISLDGTSFTLRDIAFDLSAGGQGDALIDLDDGNYTVAIYSSQDTATADAYLFNIRVDGGDGLDFTISAANGTNPQADNDMIEYVGVFRGVGADVLVGENFI